MPVIDKAAQKIAKQAAPAAANAARSAGGSSLFGSALNGSNNIMNTAQMGLFFLPIVSGVLGWFGKAPGFIGKPFQKASALVAAPTAFAEANTVESALDKAHAQASKLIGSDKLDKIGEIASRTTGSLEKAAGKADQYINGVSKCFQFAKDKVSSGITDVKGMSVQQAVIKGAIHVGSAKMAYDSLEKTATGAAALKDMVQDITGKRPGTIELGWKLLTGGLPKTVKQSGFQYLLTTGARTVADIVGITVNTRFARDQNMGGKAILMSMGLQMGVGMLSNFITTGNESPEVYGTMKAMQASGQPLNPEIIAQFIGSADKNAKASGGVDNQAVQILARKYAAEGLTAENILKKIDSGEINKDRAELKSTQVMQARAPQARTQTPAQQANPQSAIGVHTDRLMQQQMGMGMPFAYAGTGR